MDTKQVIARFEAERQALALMDHPHIAKVLEAGATETGRPFFVMELVKGVPITRYCDENNLDTPERLGLFVQVCQAIQHAHQKGIIHRDIKPSNILIADHDGVPVPKIIDFGIAKATTDQPLTDKTLFTAFEQFIGTPAYMSPEQAKLSGLDVDTRSDIYSLGVLLYELLTGKTPFEPKRLAEAGLDEVRRIIREEEPLRPSTRLRTLTAAERTTVAKHRQCEPPKLLHLLHGDLDWIVLKAMEKDRTRRYETANGLAMDVRRYLADEPIVARPPSKLYEFQKTFRRHKAGFAATAAIIIVLAVGGLASAWQAVRATRAEREQTRLRQDAVAEKANEARLRKVAQAQELLARRTAYSAQIFSAQADWENNNLDHLWGVLTETESYADRGFEWYYWQRMCRLDLATLRGHLAGVLSVAFSPDGRRIVSGSGDHTVKVWEAETGRELLTFTGHADRVLSVAFSPDGRRIVSGSADQTARVWEAATGRELLTLRGHAEWVVSVAFSPDGKRIVSGSADRTVRVWEADTGRELLTLRANADYTPSVAFSPDGRRVAAGNEEGTIQIWDANSGRELLTLKRHETDRGRLTPEGHRQSVRSVAFSPDGKRIASGSTDHTVKVWDADTGRDLLTLRGHAAAVDSVAFSSDGKRIVSSSDDRTVKVWEADGGRELLTLKGHAGVVHSAAFSPDGRRIASGSGDKTVVVWAAATLEEVSRWQREEREAQERWAVHEREAEQVATRQQGARLTDEGAIKRWLILAPLPLAQGQNGGQGLLVEQVPNENQLRPRAGEVVRANGRELAWTEARFEDGNIDFKAFLGLLRSDDAVAYAVAYVTAEADLSGLLLKLGSDDEARVYLNGKLVYEYPVPRGFDAEADTVAEIGLKQGINTVVFKVANETGGWKGSVHFTDREGNPVKGIKVTLNPGAKGS